MVTNFDIIKRLKELEFYIESNRQFLEFIEREIAHEEELPLDHQNYLKLNDLYERRQCILMALSELHDSVHSLVQQLEGGSYEVA